MDLSFCCKVPFSLYFLHPFALTVAREHFFHWKPSPTTPVPAGRGGPGRWAGPRVSQGQKVLSPHRQVPYGEAGSLGKDLPGQDFQPLEPLQPCAICRSQAGGIPPLYGQQVKEAIRPQFVQPAADPLGALLQDGVVVAHQEQDGLPHLPGARSRVRMASACSTLRRAWP